MTHGTNHRTGWTEIPGRCDTLRINGRARLAHELERPKGTVAALDEYDGPSYAAGLYPNPAA